MDESRETGRYGRFGGAYVPETLVAAVDELAAAFGRLRGDPAFQAELKQLLATYAGRPTPLTPAERFARECGCSVWLKREDLLHTGAHKINNALGQALVARHLGKTRLIAETGAGQHGVATATVAARLGFECVIYMGAEDMRRQALNVYRMRLLGAEVREVRAGSRTLKDAINEALRDWVANSATTHYLLGSALGPHPFPAMVREFHRVIGDEARAEMLKSAGGLPDVVVACVGGGSNAIGIFTAFLEDPVELIGVEAGGRGPAPGDHAARFPLAGEPRLGVLHGAETFLLQDADGNILPTHSVSAGLDYAAVGPEHARLYETGRARNVRASDAEALAAFRALARLEGIIPALESAHALAHVMTALKGSGRKVLVNLSGRGDKDVDQVRNLEGGA